MTRAARFSMLCEIRAATGPLAAEMEHVVAYCAAQVGIHATVLQLPPSRTGAARITLRLPPAAAGPGDPVWCLVCRLACLCPQARVGVLVQTDAASAPTPAPALNPTRHAHTRTLPEPAAPR